MQKKNTPKNNKNEQNEQNEQNKQNEQNEQNKQNEKKPLHNAKTNAKANVFVRFAWRIKAFFTGLTDAKKRAGTSTLYTALVIAVVVAFNAVLFSLASIFGWYLWANKPLPYNISEHVGTYLEAINPTEEKIEIFFFDTEENIKKDQNFGRILDTCRQFEERFSYYSVGFYNIYTDYQEVDALATLAEKHLEKIESAMPSDATDSTTGNATGSTTGSTTGDPNSDTGDANDADKPRVNIGKQSVAFKAGDAVQVISFVTFYTFIEERNDAQMAYNGEEVVATVTANVLCLPRKTALFTNTHGENSTTSLYNLLVSAGYNIGTLDLGKEDIAEECSLIVIANPIYDFEDYAQETNFYSEIDKLEAFLADGGTLFVMRSPEADKLTRLDAFLAENGLASSSGELIKDAEQAVDTTGYLLLTDFGQGETSEYFEAEVRLYNSSRIIFGKSSPITLTPVEGYTVSPILYTSPSAEAFKDGEATRDGSFVVMAESKKVQENGKTSHIILASSTDIASYEMMETKGYANEELFYTMLSYTDDAVVPIGANILVLNAYPLENLTTAEARTYFWCLAVALPLVIAGVGIFVCLRRKHR